jgi:hypothetical protein
MKTTLMHHGFRALSSKSTCGGVAFGHAVFADTASSARRGG